MMTLLDVLLAIALPFVVWRTLSARDLQRTVVLFIAFGLLVALAWARLDAPDIALVEAAVGAGLTGALLVATVGTLDAENEAARVGRRTRLLAAVPIVAFAACVEALLLAMHDGPGLEPAAAAALPDSGVDHLVTAVLLNFRGYDTVLETAVLVTAAVASRSVRTIDLPRPDPTISPLLAAVVRLLVPASVLVAGYLLWRGSHAPGGAFQASTVLAGESILLILAGMLHLSDSPGSLARRGVAVGPGLFVVIATIPLVLGMHLLEYPAGTASTSIVAIEVALTISIALVLVLFFPGSTGGSGSRATSKELP